MYRTQILLDPEQHRLLSEIAKKEKRSFSDIMRELIDQHLKEHRQQILQAAAQLLQADYQQDDELTVFTALDGEDFHAEG
jgi:predicted CopG family antitoxin